jgi:iron complex transport system ATP-binding protein
MTPLVECHNLAVSYHSKQVLKNITFSVSAHEYVCIVGPNGAGKSSLLKALMGIAEIELGELLIKQHKHADLNQKQLAQLISYVPQTQNQSLTFGVEEFIKMSRYPFHSPVSAWTEQDQTAVNYALDITKTQQFRHRNINELSGGERQRVMIAAALAQQTPILLLDEPMSFLDPHHQAEVQQILHELNKGCELTIIEVSHDINHASQHSDKIIALKDGQLLWQGDSSSFLNAERLTELYEHEFVFVTHPQTGKAIALPSQSIGNQSD